MVRASEPRRLAALFLVAGGALLPCALPAQVTEGPLSPAGRLRLEVSPSFTHWSERFGLRVDDGVTVEEREALGLDLSDEAGRRVFPGLTTLERTVASLTDDASFQAVAGRTRGTVARDVTRIPFSLSLGVFEWLTLGVTVPVVKTRTEVAFAFDADTARATVGISPAVDSPSELSAFLQELTTRAAAAANAAEALCAAGQPGCDEARALAGRAGDLLAGLTAAYQASPFFLLEGSAAAMALSQRVAALGDDLAAAGLGSVTAGLPLATTMADAETLPDLFAAPPLLTEPPGTRVGLWTLGDVEATAALRLLEGEVRDTLSGALTRWWQVGARALVRFPTGTVDDPDVALDLGSGDAQLDLEAGAFANLRVGRIGLWADGRYGVQRAATLRRRVAPPDVVFPPASTGLPVRWTPGDYVQLELSPRWHLTDELAVTASWRFYREGEATYELAGTLPDDVEVDLPDPALLAEESGGSVHHLGGGLVFSTLQAWREGRTGKPFEVRLSVASAVAGSGGQTPASTRLGLGLRIYQRLWGS